MQKLKEFITQQTWTIKKVEGKKKKKVEVSPSGRKLYQIEV